MEEYRDKLEKLDLLKLKNLRDRYLETISKLESRWREARYVSMTAIEVYTKKEIEKKKLELAEIELIIMGKNN